MTDSELLELAATAMGYKYMNSALWDGRDVVEYSWNPLEDDGHALRMAVKLTVDIVYDFDRVMVVFGNKDASCITEYFYDLPQPTDRYAATRRAIVRAAVEIGKEVK